MRSIIRRHLQEAYDPFNADKLALAFGQDMTHDTLKKHGFKFDYIDPKKLGGEDLDPDEMEDYSQDIGQVWHHPNSPDPTIHVVHVNHDGSWATHSIDGPPPDLIRTSHKENKWQNSGIDSSDLDAHLTRVKSHYNVLNHAKWHRDLGARLDRAVGTPDRLRKTLGDMGFDTK